MSERSSQKQAPFLAHPLLGGGQEVLANRPNIGVWEMFSMIELN